MTMTPNLSQRLPRGRDPVPPGTNSRRPCLIFLTQTLLFPSGFLMGPDSMSSWNNYIHGDCVSAEEAFRKGHRRPQTFIPEKTVVDWASAHGYLNGRYPHFRHDDDADKGLPV